LENAEVGIKGFNTGGTEGHRVVRAPAVEFSDFDTRMRIYERRMDSSQCRR